MRGKTHPAIGQVIAVISGIICVAVIIEQCQVKTMPDGGNPEGELGIFKPVVGLLFWRKDNLT